jgi:hypothetical protein
LLAGFRGQPRRVQVRDALKDILPGPAMLREALQRRLSAAV